MRQSRCIARFPLLSRPEVLEVGVRGDGVPEMALLFQDRSVGLAWSKRRPLCGSARRGGGWEGGGMGGELQNIFPEFLHFLSFPCGISPAQSPSGVHWMLVL